MRPPAGGRLQALPQPVLQRVEADQHWVGWCEEMLRLAVSRALPPPRHRPAPRAAAPPAATPPQPTPPPQWPAPAPTSSAVLALRTDMLIAWGCWRGQ